jgi:hypothetical protein
MPVHSRETQREILRKLGKNPEEYTKNNEKEDSEKRKKHDAEIKRKRTNIKKEMKKSGLIR